MGAQIHANNFLFVFIGLPITARVLRKGLVLPPGSDMPATAHPIDDLPTRARFVRLAPIAAVGLDAARCLHLRKSWVGCTECRTACPIDCLTLETGVIGLDATACLGCGRCAAACPTAALAVDGFDLDPPAAGRVTLACPRHAAAGPGVVRVPCIGGLHPNDLLSCLDRLPETDLALGGDTPCATCPAGRKDATPSATLMGALAPALQSSAVPSDRVTVLSRPSLLPDGNSLTGKGTPNRPAGTPASRRGFFSGLGRALTERVTRRGGARPDSEASPGRPIPFARGIETGLLMHRLAARQGRSPGGIAMAAARVGETCRLHGGCTRVCPTGALFLHDAAGRRQLLFAADRCIDCGSCARSCPENALQIDVPRWRAFDLAPKLLAERPLVACADCGDATGVSDADGHCPRCAKSAALARAAFALFGRASPPRPAETGPP